MRIVVELTRFYGCRLNLEGVAEASGTRISTAVVMEAMMMATMTTTSVKTTATTTVTTRGCLEGVWWFPRCVWIELFG